MLTDDADLVGSEKRLAAETENSFAVTGCKVGTRFFVKGATDGLNGS